MNTYMFQIYYGKISLKYRQTFPNKNHLNICCCFISIRYKIYIYIYI